MTDDKFKASIGGIDFDAQDIGDTLSNAIVRHEFPDRDGALLENLGERARVVRIRAYFLNADYDRHEDLLNLMEVKDTYELVHPEYGVIVGYAEEVHVRHDDRDQCAEIDITFVEDLIGSTEETLVDVPDVESATEQSFLSGVSSQLSSLSQDIANDMLSLKNSVDLRKYTTQLNSCVSSVQGTLTSISNPADSILATVQFATDLPGTILGSLSSVIERYSVMFDNLKSAPTRFVSSFRNGMAQLRASFGSSPNAAQQAAINTMVKHATIAGALRLGMDLAGCYKTDEQARQDQKRFENTKAFDAAGNYLSPEIPDQVMTINDIEQSLADCRTEIQSAVALARDIRDLQDMAAALLAHADKVKIEREKIITVTVQNTLPLHLICLQYGLSYEAAERVHAINRFADPNFVSGDIKIYVQ